MYIYNPVCFHMIKTSGIENLLMFSRDVII